MKLIQSSSIPLVFCILLIVSIFSIVTKAEIIPQNENATQYEFQSAISFQTNSRGRSIRSLFDRMPVTLEIQMPTVTGEMMHLIWKKTEKHYIANEYLPVILSSQSSGPDVMRDVGEFVIYRSVAICSAVVYFKKTHSLSGPIGLNYYLVNLPYNFDDAGKYLGAVDQSFIRFNGNGPGHSNPLFSHLSEILPHTLEDDDAGPSHKRQRVQRNLNFTSRHEYEENKSESIPRTIRRRRSPLSYGPYYLEILIFITHDVAQMYGVCHNFSDLENVHHSKNVHGGGNTYIQELVRDYIIHFNAVDMLFHDLRAIENLRINIAKIVIEDVLKPFDFTSDHEIEFSVTVAKLRRYLHHNHHVYTRDSYDHVLLSTNHPIKAEGIYVSGKTTTVLNMYEVRKNDKYDNGAAITILDYSQFYVLAVHEISKIFNLKTDSWTDGLELTGQCNSIMQEGSSRCENCIKWSQRSRIEFFDFFRKDRNRCFLMNPPRSLHPPFRPSYGFRPNTVCQCFGYESYLLGHTGAPKLSIGTHKCDSPLGCRYSNEGEVRDESTIYPLDGIRCSGAQVCWHHVCTLYMPKSN